MSRVEDQARRLLVAYPWRMRAEQGDEIVGTVLDALPPGSSRLSWRTALDLVRGGLNTRRRRRPPLLTRLAFDLGQTLHPRWIWWVYDRLEDPNYRRHDALRRMASLLVAFGLFGFIQGDLGLYLVPSLLAAPAAVVSARLVGQRQRDVKRARHGLIAGGSDPRMVWVETERRSLRPGRGRRVSVRPVHRSLLHRVPGAELWVPEPATGGSEQDGGTPGPERRPDPAP